MTKSLMENLTFFAVYIKATIQKYELRLKSKFKKQLKASCDCFLYTYGSQPQYFPLIIQHTLHQVKDTISLFLTQLRFIISYYRSSRPEVFSK